MIASASATMRSISAAQLGMSRISPCTMPADQTPWSAGMVDDPAALPGHERRQILDRGVAATGDRLTLDLDDLPADRIARDPGRVA